jgi:hypothetical protein
MQTGWTIYCLLAVEIVAVKYISAETFLRCEDGLRCEEILRAKTFPGAKLSYTRFSCAKTSLDSKDISRRRKHYSTANILSVALVHYLAWRFIGFTIPTIATWDFFFTFLALRCLLICWCRYVKMGEIERETLLNVGICI